MSISRDENTRIVFTCCEAVHGDPVVRVTLAGDSRLSGTYYGKPVAISRLLRAVSKDSAAVPTAAFLAPGSVGVDVEKCFDAGTRTCVVRLSELTRLEGSTKATLTVYEVRRRDLGKLHTQRARMPHGVLSHRVVRDLGLDSFVSSVHEGLWLELGSCL
jgi:hypothetical protein